MTYLSKLTNRLRLILPGSNFLWLTNFDNFKTHPRSILCIPAEGLGDVMMDVPAMCSVKQNFPDAKLTVLTHFNHGTHEICKLVPAIDETIDIGLKNFRWPTVIRFMLTRFWKLLFQLRKKNFDLAIVFWPNPVRRLLLAGTGSKYWIYSNLRDDFPGRQNQRLLQLLGIEMSDKKPVFQIPTPPNYKQILPDNLPRPFVGIHPFCGMQWRQWQKFDELRQQLEKLAGTVIIVGRKKDYLSKAPGLDLVNKLSIPELFWIIKQCDVFVTADSGPMHISLALGTPTVAIFGPVKPSMRIAEDETTPHSVLYRPTAESEKTLHATQRQILSNEAMQSISVNEVLDCVKKYLR